MQAQHENVCHILLEKREMAAKIFDLLLSAAKEEMSMVPAQFKQQHTGPNCCCFFVFFLKFAATVNV